MTLMMASNWPVVSVHSSVLYTGKVLLWDAWDFNGSPAAMLWDPATNTMQSVPDPFNGDAGIFCAGHAMLPDGRIVIVGGHMEGVTGVHVFWPETTSSST